MHWAEGKKKISSTLFIIEHEMEAKEHSNIAICSGILIGNCFCQDFKSNLSSQQ